jgi:hypothetical protein
MPISASRIAEWKAQAHDLVRESVALDARDASTGDRNRSFDLNAPVAYDLAEKAVPSLLRERDNLIALLREIEWVDVGPVTACPVCGGQEPSPEHPAGSPSIWTVTVGHRADCLLAAHLST